MTHTGPRGCLPRGPQDKLRDLGAYGRTATETLGLELGYTPYTTYTLVAEFAKEHLHNKRSMFYIQHPTLPRPTVPWASSPGSTSGAPLTNPGLVARVGRTQSIQNVHFSTNRPKCVPKWQTGAVIQPEHVPATHRLLDHRMTAPAAPVMEKTRYQSSQAFDLHGCPRSRSSQCLSTLKNQHPTKKTFYCGVW